MKKNREAAWMSPLFCILLTFVLFLSLGFVDATAETAPVETDTTDTESDTANQNPLPFVPGYLDEPETESNYALFRSHPERYYPELDVQKAQHLSTFMPGLGQAYAGNYTKATLFPHC